MSLLSAVLIVVVVGMAVIFDPGGADTFMVPKLAVIAVGVVAGVALGFVAAGERRLRVPRPAVAPAVGALVVIAGAATLVSSDRLLAAIGLSQRFGGFVSLVLFVALGGLVVVAAAAEPDRLFGLAWAFVAGGTVAGVYAVFQQMGIDRYHFVESSGAPTKFPGSTLGNSNFLGGALAVVVPLVVMLALRDGRRAVRLACLAAGVLVAAALWIAQSRGGMLAAGIGLSVVLLLAPGVPPLARRVSAIAGAAVLAGVVISVALIVAPSFRNLPGPLKHLEVLRTESTDVRGFEWSAAWRIVLHHPVLGTGPDTFAVQYPRYRSTTDGAQLGLLLSDKPHNVLLEDAADTGVLGLGAYLALLALVARGVARRVRDRSQRGTTERLMLAGFVGAFAAYLTQALFSIDVPPLAATGWILIGALVALADPAIVAGRAAALAGATRRRLPGRTTPAGTRDRRAPRAPRTNVALRAGAAAVAVALVAVVMFPVVGSWREHLAGARDGGGRIDAAASAYSAAVRANPFESSYREAAGFLAERRAEGTADRVARKHFLAVAQQRYEEALARRPGAVVYLVDLARIETLRAQTVDPRAFSVADDRWAAALRADPHDWEVLNLRALSLAEWANATGGRHDLLLRAADGFDSVVRLRPDQAAVWVDLVRVVVALHDRARLTLTLRRAAAALHLDYHALVRLGSEHRAGH